MAKQNIRGASSSVCLHVSTDKIGPYQINPGEAIVWVLDCQWGSISNGYTNSFLLEGLVHFCCYTILCMLVSQTEKLEAFKHCTFVPQVWYNSYIYSFITFVCVCVWFFRTSALHKYLLDTDTWQIWNCHELQKVTGYFVCPLKHSGYHMYHLFLH
jgi:hypothetical protein